MRLFRTHLAFLLELKLCETRSMKRGLNVDASTKSLDSGRPVQSTQADLSWNFFAIFRSSAYQEISLPYHCSLFTNYSQEHCMYFSPRFVNLKVTKLMISLTMWFSHSEVSHSHVSKNSKLCYIQIFRRIWNHVIFK